MSVVAEFRTVSDESVLSTTLRRAPAMTVEVEREVATDPTRPILFFWAHGGSFGRFESQLHADPSVTDTTCLDAIEHGNGSATDLTQSENPAERRLYRVQVTDSPKTLYPVYVRLGAAMLGLVGRDQGWDAKLRFPTRDALAQFRQHCLNENIEFTLQRLYGPEAPSTGDNDDLTERQREALELALDDGYFEVPRQSSLSTLGGKLGVSDQAASERIRRGVKSVVADSLGEKEP